MSIMQAIVLGLIQGLTEFLPVSSSGHLAIAGHLYGRLPSGGTGPLAFDVLLHFASVAAIVTALRRDVWSLVTTRRRLILPLAAGTVPVGVAGLLFAKHLEAARQVMPVVGASLMFTGLVLALGERIGRRSRDLAAAGFRDGLLVGCVQAVALVPGISRSGMTISGGLFRGMTREACVRFSFLLAIPAILGASAFEVPGMIRAAGRGDALPLIAGTVASLAASIIAIKVLLGLVRRTSPAVFAYYCVPMGMVVFIASAPQMLAGWLAASVGLSGASSTITSYLLAGIVTAAVARVVFFDLLRKKRSSQAAAPH